MSNHRANANTKKDEAFQSRLWKPGQSGNPKGRPRIISDLRAACRDHTADAITTLLSVMESKASPPSARVAAASELLNRGWGRASITVDATIVAMDTAKMHVEALRRLSDRARNSGPVIIDVTPIPTNKECISD